MYYCTTYCTVVLLLYAITHPFLFHDSLGVSAFYIHTIPKSDSSVETAANTVPLGTTMMTKMTATTGTTTRDDGAKKVGVRSLRVCV